MGVGHIPSFQFGSFQYRLLFYLVALVGIIQLLMFLSVNFAAMASARSAISENLLVEHRVFNTIMDNRIRQLSENARLLSMDYAFKQSIFSVDNKTLISIIENLRQRIRADFITLVSLEYAVMADTIRSDLSGKQFMFPGLIEEAEEKGEFSSVTIREGGYYQVEIIPILAPDPIAWLVIGFLINDALLKEIKNLLLAQISVFELNSAGNSKMVASTLSEGLKKLIPAKVNSADLTLKGSQSIKLDQDEYISLISPLEKKAGSALYILLQRSMDDVLEPYYRLRTRLAIISLIGLLISFAVSMRISRSVTRPVSTLVDGVRHIENGNYDLHIAVTQKDELGELSNAFNNMAKGLQERDLVSDLLGKVVSPAIAKELLSKKVELGGEEKEVTILFSDVRNFTTLSENHPPAMILNMLNRYLTVMSDIIERHGGVIDKYIGDAIMALFGAPISHPDDVDHALNAALDMGEALDKLNVDFKNTGIPSIDIGIGINTDIVVAGNMGSAHRLNYTVIGDGVNLASRLEGLTKSYKKRIILSDSTYKKVKDSYIIEQIGEAYVKGKSKPTIIYALTGRAGKESVQ
ncbi:MAG: HAMP domain-containing protein [Nitrospirae bacterium]|nr:HAMP domain-containing protein [Nitrospirota bacterium]